MMGNSKFLKASTALAVGLLASVPAYAAEGGAGQGESQLDSTGDIVVTAQRRAEIQRDVPISMTVLQSDALVKAGISTTTELAKVSPGVVLPLYGAFILPSIRGISSSGVALGDNPNVAIYVDGVYQASQSAGLGDLPDVQSVQILKGPQGSLYGQNAAGGAIIIDTMAPSHTTHGRMVAGVGRFNDKVLNGYVTTGLTDTLAMMLSAAYRRRDGINADLVRGGYDRGLRTFSARGKLLWEPSDTMSFTLGGYFTQHNDSGVYSNAALNGNSLGIAIANLPCAFGGLACFNLPIASKPHTFSMNPAPDTQIRTYGTSLRAKFEIDGFGTINTTTAYNEAKVINFSDVDGTPVNTSDFWFEIREHDFIQEVNYASEQIGTLSLQAGLFYMNKVEKYVPQVNRIYPFDAFGIFNTAFPATTPAFQIGQFGSSDKKSYAAYFQADLDLTSKLTFSLSGRYSYEKVRVAAVALPPTWKIGDPEVAPLPDPRGSFSFSKFTPRAVIRYRPDDYNTVYASYSQGFKSGYVNPGSVNICTPSPACIDAPVAPEVVDAWEVGYKGRIAGILDLSLAAFHYDYKNIQVFIYDINAGQSRFQNAASGKINGLELDSVLHATPDLTLKAGASYLDATYSNFPAASVYVPAPGGFGNSLLAMNVSGNRMMRTPEWTLNGSINYSREVKGGTLGLYIAANYNSGIYYDPNNRVRQPGYALLDAEISFAPASLPGSRIALWGKNLTNHDYLQSALESQIGDSGTYADPVAYGVRLEYSF